MSGTVWVTGAASGMGETCARRYGADGVSVGCIDASPRIVEVAGEIEAAGGVARAAVCDVTDPVAVESAAAELDDAIGPPSVAVLAAGIRARPAPIADLEPSDWDQVLAVNLTGVFLTMRAAIGSMRRVGGGSIVVIASAAGLGAGPNYAAYDASKHGVVGLMKVAANELAAEGIRVNAVCPAWVDTPMLNAELADLGLDRERGIRELAAAHLIKRLIEPAEVIDAVQWLSSPRASMVTGVALPVDGGMLAATFS